MSQQFNTFRGRLSVRRLSAYLTVLAALLLTFLAPSARAQAACDVVYAITPQSSTAFGATLTIENTGTTAWTSWTLTWTFANGQSISSLWNGVESQSGAVVTVASESYNGAVAAGGSVTGVGFNGAWLGTTNAIPTNFAINGTACNGGSTGGGGSFSLAPTASTASVVAGSTGTDTVNVTDAGGFTGSVSLAATGLPTGVTAAFGTNPATGSSTVTFTAASTAAAGTSTVTITGTSGTLSATTTIALTVTAASSGCSTTNPIIPYVALNGVWSATSLSPVTVASGTAVDLGPWPQNGTWSWTGPNGFTASTREIDNITLTTGANTYTATYTISGCTYTQAFVITVSGTTTNPIVPYIAVGGVWNATPENAVTVPTTTTAVDLGPWPQNGTWSWTGPNGFTASTREIDNITLTTGANVYTATYTIGGTSYTETFTITVGTTTTNPIVPYIAVGGVWNTTPESAVTVPTTTTSVDLGPWPQGGTWSWTGPNGFTASTREIDNITLAVGANVYTASYTAGGTTYTQAFTITVSGTGSCGTTNPIVPYIEVSGTWITPSSSTATVSSTTTPVSLGPWPQSGGTWSWTGPNGFTASTREIDNIALSAGANTYTATYTISGCTYTQAFVITAPTTGGGYAATAKANFLTLYGDFHPGGAGVTTGSPYFDQATGIPYHSVEKLIIEAPDYGHETVSETFSYYIWLESLYGAISGNWTPLTTAWNSFTNAMIPNAANQPMTTYNPADSATYAPTWDTPNDYPSTLNTSVAVGDDPLANELHTTYNTWSVYGAHWILDTTNWYGYGSQENGTTAPSFYNSYQRGPMESVWLTIPQPCWDDLKFGSPTGGYLNLFIAGTATPQWKYTDAPDADARSIQAIYWAQQYGGASAVSAIAPQAAELGDYLRYSFFDKYFKEQGCQSVNCPTENGTKNSSAYLLSWYYAWGGALDGSWSWRIGSSDVHFGYQNPLAAYALSTDATLIPKSPTAKADWTTTLQRTLQFYRWLQSDEGAIAGGATNSWGGGSNLDNPPDAWGGQYAVPPAGTPTFYGMSYIFAPSYENPPSNQWFGMQVWSMERLAEYYYATGDANAAVILKPWVKWAESVVTTSGTTYSLPNQLTWTGQPITWAAGTTVATAPVNTGLHVTATGSSQDVGLTGSYVKTLLYYSAATAKYGTQDTTSFNLAKTLLQDLWLEKDTIGISSPETGTSYNDFTSTVYVPAGWAGTMPGGEKIVPGATFESLRGYAAGTESEYPGITAVRAYAAGTGPAPVFTFHRFWAQTDVASAYAVYYLLFPNE